MVQTAAHQPRQIEAGGQFQRLLGRRTGPQVFALIPHRRGRAQAQTVGHHARQLVVAVQLRQQFRLVARGQPPQPRRDACGKAQPLQPVVAAPEQRPQRRERRIPSAPVQHLGLDHVAQRPRPIPRHRRRQRLQLGQQMIRASGDQPGQGGPLRDRQVRHAFSSGRTESRPSGSGCALRVNRGFCPLPLRHSEARSEPRRLRRLRPRHWIRRLGPRSSLPASGLVANLAMTTFDGGLNW